MSLLLNDFIHCGSSNISKELWLNIQMDQINTSYIKPFGGIWTSIGYGDTCDWLDYIKYEKGLEYYEYYIANKTQTLIKIKDDAKVLKILTTNDYKNLVDSGLTVKLNNEIPIRLRNDYSYTKEILDYESINNIYDAILVDPYSNDSLYNYSVLTLLIMKPHIIEYYKSNNIKQIISEPSLKYNQLYKYIESIFKEKDNNNYNDYVQDLYNLKKLLEIELINSNIINNLIPTNMDKDRLIKVILGNIYKEKYTNKKKILQIK